MTWKYMYQYIIVEATSVSLTVLHICSFHSNIYASLCQVYILYKLRYVSLPPDGLSTNNRLVPQIIPLGLLRGLPEAKSSFHVMITVINYRPTEGDTVQSYLRTSGL